MHGFWPRPGILCAAVFGFLLVAGACNQPINEIGEGYIAPTSVNLRRDLTQRVSDGPLLKHGEHVSITDVRRRFVKVRGGNGEEGWIDALQLMSRQQMDQAKQETEKALKLPSEGSATVYETLNIHLEPNRFSPAFAKIQEGEHVNVLAHRLVPRATVRPRPPSLLKERPQPQRRKGTRERSRLSAKLPLAPKAPRAPGNWEDLSRERIDGGSSIADLKEKRETEASDQKGKQSKEDVKEVPLEDWTLVRTKNKQCGWSLSRNLVMALPDEVAQYAEGRRITSYFQLGVVQDEEKGVRHNWLWTTASKQIPYDFDSWRVFLWNRRRHRYETSYRQRDVEGYFPVKVDPADPNVFGRMFHLVMRDEDGKLRSRSYIFDGMRVHLTGTEDYRPQEEKKPESSPDGVKPENWLQRKWHALRRRVSPAD